MKRTQDLSSAHLRRNEHECDIAEYRVPNQ